MTDRRFDIERLGSNAVIVSIASAKDNEGTWVESWNFTVTLKDPNTLITHWSRIVNNNDLPLSIPHSKFSIVAVGELRRQ